MSDVRDAILRSTEFQIGDIVRQEFDDGSMGTAEIIAIAMDKAWCFYAKANSHRVQSLKRLELIEAAATSNRLNYLRYGNSHIGRKLQEGPLPPGVTDARRTDTMGHD